MSPEQFSLLANHLWQSTLFAGAVGLLALAFRKNRAAVRYWLWLAASVKFLVPFALLAGFGRYFESRLGSRLPQPQIVSIIGGIGEPFTFPPPAPGLPARSPAISIGIPEVLFFAWLAGFALAVFFWLRESRRIRAAVRDASPLDLHIPIKVMSCRSRIEPGIVGIFRQVLLLPEGITDRLTPAQFEAILVHELCHARRRDNLAAAIHMIVEAVFWFHPLVWWIERRLIQERERACDEEVVRIVGEPQAYAEGILNVCKFYKNAPMVCVSGVGGSNLRKRIEVIMGQRMVRNLSFGKKLLLAAAATAVVAGPVFFGLVNVPTSEAQKPATTQGQDILSQGIRAFSEGRYEAAVAYLQQALELEPASLEAQLYLAKSNAKRYVPGNATPENRQYADLAIQGFQTVLARNPNNIGAVAGMAEIYSNTNEPRRAREYFLRYAELAPLEPTAFYGAGAVDWLIVYDKRNPPSPQEQANLIEEGLRHLDIALALNPDYEDAMTYKNLLFREKARLASDPVEKNALVAEADQWFNKALEVRRSSRNVTPSNSAATIPPPPPPPPPPPRGEQPLRVNPAAAQAQLVYSQPPSYPPLAKAAGIQGAVVLMVIINNDGTVREAREVSGHPVLTPPAIEAVRQWRYRSFQLNGQPTEVVTTVNINYKLQ